MTHPKRATPPGLARWLIERCTIAADRDAVVGDLLESHEQLLTQPGVSRRRAALWFWQQALRSVVPAFKRRWPSSIHHAPKGHGMNAFWQDLRFSWRLARRRPFVSVVAGLSLVVGMSLSLTVFTLLNAIAIRPLSVQSPDELVVVLEQRSNGVNHTLSHPDFVDHRANQRAFVDLLAVSSLQVNAQLGSHTQMVPAELVSGSYFQTLGVRTVSGRPLQEADDRPAAPPVAVVSEPLWRSWGREVPLALNEVISLQGSTFSVVGLTPASFGGAQIGRQNGIWIPLAQEATFARVPGLSLLDERRASWLTVMGRLRPGVSIETASEDLNRIEAGLWQQAELEAPRRMFASPGARGDAAFPESMESMLNTLLLAALLVLLVACANVANLLMARAADRAREMTMRVALGAGWLRLVRMLFLEALVLGGTSATISLVVAYLGAQTAASFITRFGQPVALNLSIDARTALFVIGLGLVATILSSLAPVAHVLRATRTNALADGGRSVTTGTLAGRIRFSLLVGQFALSLALVVSAVLLARTVSNLRHAPTGLATDEVALLAASPRAARYAGPQHLAYVADALARLQREPGVVAASYASVPPVNAGGSRATVHVPGYEPEPDEEMELNYNEIAADYFTALGIEILDGQPLPPWRSGQQPIPMVVNTTMARRYWPGARAVGQRLHLSNDTEGPIAEVVGVVADAKYRAMREAARPSYYLPLGVRAPRDGTFHVRVQGNPSAALPALRRALIDVDPAVPVSNTRTLTAQLNSNITDDRLAMAIGVVLAIAALVLAGVGLFGAMSHMVGQRTREIGVRLALGATRAGIRRLVLGQALLIASAGTVAGLALAGWATSFMASRLFGVGRFDPGSFAGAAAILAGVAALAAHAPARRASSVDPVNTLREE